MLNLTEAVVREQLIVGLPCIWKRLLFCIHFLAYSSVERTPWKDELSEVLGFSSHCFCRECVFSALKLSEIVINSLWKK